MKTIRIVALLFITQSVLAQETFPLNGVSNNFEPIYAFTNAHIVLNPTNAIANGTLLIKGDKIIAVDSNLNIPKGAIIKDLAGDYIYPSFIDLYSEEIKISNVDSQQGGRTITLYNCMIQTINHDTLSYADSQPILYNVVFQPEHFNIDSLDKDIAEENVEKSQAINGNLAGILSNRQAGEQDPVVQTFSNTNTSSGGRAFKGSYNPSKETLRK